MPLRFSVFSPFRQCWCATRSKAVVIGSCCCSPFRALSGLPTAFFRGLGRLGWSRRSGQPSPCGAGSWCALDFCTYPPAVSGCPPRPHGVNLNKKGPPVSRPFCDLRFYAAAGRRIRVRPFNRIRRRAGMSACPTCERSSPQQHSNPLLGNRCLPH